MQNIGRYLDVFTTRILLHSYFIKTLRLNIFKLYLRLRLRPCLHGGGITLLEGLPSRRVISVICFFLFPLHERRDNPGVGITLPACWGYPFRRDNFCLFRPCKRSRRDNPSRRDKFLWFQVTSENAQNFNLFTFHNGFAYKRFNLQE